MLNPIQSVAQFLFRKYTEEKLICYHCDDSMRISNAVEVVFDGEVRKVCCHGCAAILNNIESHQLTASYLQTKQNQHIESAK